MIINKFAVELNKDIYTGLSNMASNGIFIRRIECIRFKVTSLIKVNKGLHVANQASPNAKTSVRSLIRRFKR